MQCPRTDTSQGTAFSDAGHQELPSQHMGGMLELTADDICMAAQIVRVGEQVFCIATEAVLTT